MHLILSQQITGIIIAGGLGKRMGSANKGLQLLYGKPMLVHILNCIEPQVGSVMINVNHNIDAYAVFQKPSIQDSFPDYMGPLAGIHAGLMHCKTEYLLSVPCDTPYLPNDLVAQLSLIMNQDNVDMAIACTNENAQIKTHPIICLMKTSVRPHLEKFLQQGGKKVQAWQAELNAKQVVFSDENAFRNINHAEELLLANTHK